MTNAWTPGPWVLLKEEGYYARAVDAPKGWHCDKTKKRICSVRPHRRTKYANAEAEANARLIAAAPDMAEALENVELEHRAGLSMAGETIEAVRRALAKARSEAP